MNQKISMTLMLILLAGCGELAYKRGASPQELEVAKKSCQNAGDKAAVDQCLESKGWAVQQIGAIGLPDSELFASATDTPDNRNPSQPHAVAVSDTATTSSNSSNIEIVSTQAAPIKPPPNPFETYKINSWWKMGGGREALEQSMGICSEKLGEAHQPDRKQQIFTRAFAACMYENGWRGLREK